ncbi:hypothetical protein EJD97_020556 [Solanum chilense]|uniref:Uncharacterized protein n=1 Tax=Solanum chilense TaxID=4083 RepID=A0A6N2AH10_SOLCI|nr:hypothetical protein EJD97_020556 [Solanum chilense]
MLSHNLINVEYRIILSSVSRFYRNKVDKISHPVHNNPYGVIFSPSLRKTNHEVHINGLQVPSRKLTNLSKTARIKMFWLNLLTIRTLGHIFCNVVLHAIPPIDLLKIMIHLGGTWMYGISGTMGLCNDPGPQIIHILYTQPALVPKYVVISQR